MTQDDTKPLSAVAPSIADLYPHVDKFGLYGLWLLARGITQDLPEPKAFQRAARRRLGWELPTGGMVVFNLAIYVRPSHEGTRWAAEILTVEDGALVGTPWDDLQQEIATMVKLRIRQWGYPKGDRL